MADTTTTNGPVFTLVRGSSRQDFLSLETAIRAWDFHTARYGQTTGGIQVTVRDAEGNLTRDGWILHTREDGTVYLNPNLQEA